MKEAPCEKEVRPTSTNQPVLTLPWYRSLSGPQWKTLVAANLSWTLDSFEFYVLFVTVAFALHQLVTPAEYSAIPRYAGYVIAATLFGWGVGGVIGGIVADYIGRKRMLMLAILAYSLTTGLSALSWNWESLAFLRFFRRSWSRLRMGHRRFHRRRALAGPRPRKGRRPHAGRRRSRHNPRLCRMAVNRRHRPKRLALDVSDRRAPGFDDRLDSPPHAGSGRTNSAPKPALKRRGAELFGEHAALTRFTLVDLFADRTVRWSLIGALLMMLSLTLAFWGVATFIPTFVGSVAAEAHLPAAAWAGYAALVTGVCGTFGFISLGFLADAIGRKPVTMLFYLMCLILTPVVYLWAHSVDSLWAWIGVFGFFTLGIWAWAPVWLSELFPTRMRGTAIAFCFNAPRLVACIGPLIAGTLIVSLGGYGPAATIISLFFIVGFLVAPFLPETNGRPLPEIDAAPGDVKLARAANY